MGESKKTEAKTDQAKGKIKETVGRTVGDEDLEAEGRDDVTLARRRISHDHARFRRLQHGAGPPPDRIVAAGVRHPA